MILQQGHMLSVLFLCYERPMSSTILYCVRPIGMCVTEPVSPAAAAAAAAAARSIPCQHVIHNKQIHRSAQHKTLTTNSLFFLLPVICQTYSDITATKMQCARPGHDTATGGQQQKHTKTASDCGSAGMQAVVCPSRKVGWDRDDVWLAHCCHLDGAEIKQWAHHGIGVAHCPSSNMRLASGICPVSPEHMFMLAKTQKTYLSGQPSAHAS